MFVRSGADRLDPGTQSTCDSKLEEAFGCHRRRELVPARRGYESVLRLQPDNPDATHYLGMIAFEQGEIEASKQLVLRSVELRPTSSAFYSNCGLILAKMGDLSGALRALHRSVELNPDAVNATRNLGLVLELSGRFQEAEAVYASAPDTPEAADFAPLSIRALALGGSPCSSTGLNVASDLPLAVHTAWVEAFEALSTAWEGRGNLEEALCARRRALGLAPQATTSYSAYLFLMLHSSAASRNELFRAHAAWPSVAWSTGYAPCPQMRSNRIRLPLERLRIGYVSPYLVQHPVSRFLEPLLKYHDRSQFAVTCYSDAKREDNVTARLRSTTEVWRHTAPLSDDALYELIVEDGIDILVDLTGHIAINRLPVFARKAAAIQISYLYPHTTGLRSFDARFTDIHAEPPGAADRYSTEPLLRLPHSAWCYRPPEVGPDVTPAPLLRTGVVTFGSFNRFLKVTSEMVRIWACILQRVPRSRIKVLVEDETEAEKLITSFKDKHIAESRVEPLLRRSHSEYLGLCHDVDIALDTYPYTGHTTSYDMLWMGIPVVTLAGEPAVSRVGISLNRNIDLESCVADSAEKYVDAAVALASDSGRLQNLRMTLRERMRFSKLMDRSGFTSRVEYAYLNLYKRTPIR